MPKPPSPKQKTYRGRIRSDMRSAYNHLAKLIAWNAKYLSGPVTNYPNQLAPVSQVNNISAAAVQLSQWLQQLGAIPSR